jgi:hypothetical protein
MRHGASAAPYPVAGCGKLISDVTASSAANLQCCPVHASAREAKAKAPLLLHHDVSSIFGGGDSTSDVR